MLLARLDQPVLLDRRDLPDRLAAAFNIKAQLPIIFCSLAIPAAIREPLVTLTSQVTIPTFGCGTELFG